MKRSKIFVCGRVGLLGMLLTFAGCGTSIDSQETVAAMPESEPQKTPNSPNSASAETEEIVLAGGCFWCTEAVFEELKGVQAVDSGYSGGTEDSASYKLVSAGLTDHAESIRIRYNPEQIKLEQILEVFFLVAHDPTQKNRQGADIGRHYRSAVFFADEAQKQAVEEFINQLEKKKVFDAPIVTTLEPLTGFYDAEDYHQNYARLQSGNPYIQCVAMPKLAKVREKYKDWLADEK